MNIILIGLGVIAVGVLVALLPDFIRYVKLRMM